MYQCMKALLIPLILSLILALPFVAAKSSRTDIQGICKNDSPITNNPECSPWEHQQVVERGKALRRIGGKAKSDAKRTPRTTLLDALHAFDRYQETAGAEIQRFEDLYRNVPKDHKRILERTIAYNKNFEEARSRIEINARLCKLIVNHGLEYYNITRAELSVFEKENEKTAKKPAHRSMVSQALKHMVRDYSPEGKPERDATFPYILSTISSELSPPPADSYSKGYKILLPGSALGGLAYDISLLGPHLHITTNEYSSAMNLAYRYISSSSVQTTPIIIHPYLETWSHARTRSSILRPVELYPPATTPGYQPPLLIEGDFTLSFHHQSSHYDMIATLFFIDTAQNLLSYLETIFNLLRPGGMWVNVGPLLYGTAPWLQLSKEEVVRVAEEVGFVFEESFEKEGVGYDFGMGGLYQHQYVGLFWRARKPV
ncbi:unnamed protein product [Zymoseptoria tritici ST99CH_1A5]|uniref:Uncharacterized protein n=4 Tax=Zymoseptoria tritici TaxID=1047171 RepID=A0A1X7RYN1_ZYMT9|nr:unnamed protein product [Zymoseptoria tritici ST99CH_3D7]SMR55367.1 unnamed protein product [Zymoseptoria tritici ST99CH_1E4]SMR57743.1 unnamed protein product [Zymoseptoria tritici ST99CH_3D1]SMY26179.1 unnamed protein product [Zymoseptoria tritici ST99CH_1A5]